MRSPENVLKSLSEKAKNKEYRYERLYRNLYNPVKVEATDLQRDMVEELGNRAEKVRNHQVNPREDNMLKIVRC